MGYIYQADVWCDSCGLGICDDLNAAGKKPEDPNNHESFDSDEYPKGFCEDQDESDSPQHCAAGENCCHAITLPSGRKIGALLDCPLTYDGVLYVREAISQGGEVADIWKEFFDFQLSF